MVPNIHAEVAYDILGVPHDADMPAIRQAFRKLALKHHPDAVPTEQKAEASRQFARINQAYELLRDSDKRRRYDGLLGRGITPDLSAEVGDVGIASLGDILGQIEALDVTSRAYSAKREMTEEFRDLLFSSLINSNDVEERVIDLVRLEGVVTKNYELPPGKAYLDDWASEGYNVVPPETANCPGGWVVVTDLRVIVLMVFGHDFVLQRRGALSRTLEIATGGGSRMSAYHWRLRSFPYPSLQSVEVIESGRVFKSYTLNLADEDGTSFSIRIKKPRLAQLLLVASVYQLPLRVRTEADAEIEVWWALFQGAIPALLWLALYLSAVILASTTREASWGTAVVNSWLTPLAAYLTPPLLGYALWRCYRAWGLGRAQQVFGELATDYASAPPARSEIPSPPPSQEPVQSPEPPPPLTTPVARPVGDAPVSSRQIPVARPVKEGPGTPIDVDVPDAVREAFGGLAGNASTVPESGLVCPDCGETLQLKLLTLHEVRCSRCGCVFTHGDAR